MTNDEIAALRSLVDSMAHVLPLRADERFVARVVAADDITLASCGSEGAPDEWRARRDLIIGAVNALPSLLTAAEERAKWRELLTELLNRLDGQHKNGLPIRQSIAVNAARQKARKALTARAALGAE